ncbi:MAG: GNAT family N-acetyltransferase [Flavobacteriaceae bacterium]|jgi:RimJ/RimL family protein N-acetyltransferase|nr:GNAT family N-acetyltransferase [Flavobacteriaceae bacterium]
MTFTIPDFNLIPWNNLIHTQGRATDIISLFQAVNHSDEQISKMAIYEIANRTEQEGRLASTSPLLLYYLLNQIEKKSIQRDFLLRSIKRIATVIAYQWETYRNNRYSLSTDLGILWQADKPYYWPNFISEQEDQSLWSKLPMEQIAEIAWHYSAQLLIDYKKTLEELKHTTPLENGLLYDILTIIKMIKPQNRITIERNLTWKTEYLLLRAIHPTDRDNLCNHLQGEVAKYLSFNPNGNMRIIDFYIDQSIIEQQAGTALVLVIEHPTTGEFLGSCALNDINNESVELGLWLKETAQGKGLGVKIAQAMIDFIKTHINTSYILYNVEQGNHTSIRIPEILQFSKGIHFLIEPTSLKNSMREMQEYRLYL